MCNGRVDPADKCAVFRVVDCNTTTNAKTHCPALCGTCTTSTTTTSLPSVPTTGDGIPEDDVHTTPAAESRSAKTTIIALAAAGGSALVLGVLAAICLVSRRKWRRQSYAIFTNDNDEDNDGMQMPMHGLENDDGCVLDENNPLFDLSGDTIAIANYTITSPVESSMDATAFGSTAATSTSAAPPSADSKFVAPKIRLGNAGQAATGLPGMMGIDESTIGRFMQEKVQAIVREFEDHGGDEDKQNLNGVLDGSYRNPPDSKLTGAALAADAAKKAATTCTTIDELMKCPEVKIARLKMHHVLALRLYTTSSYKCLNNPLRTDPPTQPHPFAATTFFISEGIKKLRAVAAERPDAFTPVVFWRGLKGMALSKAFVKQGGTEFGCMSTSADKDVAIEFSESEHPLVFKYETDNFMSRGADISFLSVYPEEKEALYPPLTYLSATKITVEEMNGRRVLVASVKPTFPT